MSIQLTLSQRSLLDECATSCNINNRTTDRHQYKLVPVYMYIKDKVNIVLFVDEQCWYGGLARACSARRWGSLYGYCDALVARTAHTFSSFWRSLSSLYGVT